MAFSVDGLATTSFLGHFGLLLLEFLDQNGAIAVVKECRIEVGCLRFDNVLAMCSISSSSFGLGISAK
jgi:hypothetical protein